MPSEFQSVLRNFGFGAVLLLALSACNYPDPAPTMCDADEMLSAQLLTPADMEIIEDDLLPTFTWSDPNDCELEMYVVRLRDDPSEDEFSVRRVDFPEQSVEWDVELEQGRQYWWTVEQVTKDPDDPDHLETGPLADEFRFFTGPMCDSADLVAPELLEPQEGAEVFPRETTANKPQTFIWDYPDGCLPDEFLVLISAQADVGPPMAADHSTGDPVTRWESDVILEENSQYYWKVAAIRNGNLGPFSEIRSFVTTEIAADLPGVIAGLVWHDACDNPVPRDSYNAGDPVPEGCIIHNGIMLGNGIMEENESRLPGVVVWVGDGECPALGNPTWGATLTGGYYYQFLPVGTYCVYIDALETENQERLTQGVWTYPYLDGPVYYTVTIELPGQVIDGADFGWDFDGEAPDFDGKIGGRIWIDGDLDWREDDFELGMIGAEVYLASGLCSAPWQENVIQTALTDSDGYYYFTPLDEGNYCVAVDEASYPPEYGRGYINYRGYDSPVASQGLPLGEGEYVMNVDFGWVWWPNVEPEIPVNCRSGPDVLYPILNYLDIGGTYYLEGRNGTNSWWYTELDCWVADATAPIRGDPGVLPLKPIPPLPDVTPPTISISYSPHAPIIGERVTYTIESYDDRTIPTITLFVDPPGPGGYSAVKVCEGTNVCTHTGGPYNYDGRLRFYAKARDEAGNETTSNIITITVEDPYL